MVQILGGFEMFARCNRDDLVALVDAGRPFTVPAHWAIMTEGDAAGSFYAITRGRARVFRGREAIAEVGPGEIIGEMSLLSGRPRRATVTSTSRMAGLRVATDEVTELFARHPRLLAALQHTYETRVARAPESTPEYPTP
jgi:CRP-like cAMP-binding protein